MLGEEASMTDGGLQTIYVTQQTQSTEDRWQRTQRSRETARLNIVAVAQIVESLQASKTKCEAPPSDFLAISRERLNDIFRFSGWKILKAKYMVDKVFSILEEACGIGAGASVCTVSPHQLSSLVRLAIDDLRDYEVHNIADDLLDFEVACSVNARFTGVAILLSGTTGCGKSTLANFLASRLGISTVLSTDSVRHVRRSLCKEEDNKVLFASTYNAYQHLDEPSGAGDENERVLEGHALQSALVMDDVMGLVDGYLMRNECIIVEGVHLNTPYMIELMERHAFCLPFVISISNEVKHKERFSTRAEAFTDPSCNKYIRYFKNIRMINDHLVKSATRHAIPVVNNTNVDRSLAALHSTIVEALAGGFAGQPIYSKGENQSRNLWDAFNRCQSTSWSSKSMLEVIRRKQNMKLKETVPSSWDIQSPELSAAQDNEIDGHSMIYDDEDADYG